MGRPIRKPEDPTADELVLAAAIKLFVMNGFDRATIRSIAREAGVTPGGIYYHYKDKADLLFKALRVWTERLVNHVTAQIEQVHDNHAARLRVFVKSHISFQLSEMNATTKLFRTWVTDGNSRDSVLTTEQAAELRAIERRHLANLRKILSQGVDGGAFRIEDITATAFAIFGICEHTLMWFTPKDATDIARISEYNASLALRLVGGKEARRRARAG